MIRPRCRSKSKNFSAHFSTARFHRNRLTEIVFCRVRRFETIKRSVPLLKILSSCSDPSPSTSRHRNRRPNCPTIQNRPEIGQDTKRLFTQSSSVAGSLKNASSNLEELIHLHHTRICLLSVSKTPFGILRSPRFVTHFSNAWPAVTTPLFKFSTTFNSIIFQSSKCFRIIPRLRHLYDVFTIFFYWLPQIANQIHRRRTILNARCLFFLPAFYSSYHIYSNKFNHPNLVF